PLSPERTLLAYQIRSPQSERSPLLDRFLRFPARNKFCQPLGFWPAPSKLHAPGRRRQSLKCPYRCSSSYPNSKRQAASAVHRPCPSAKLYKVYFVIKSRVFSTEKLE